MKIFWIYKTQHRLPFKYIFHRSISSNEIYAFVRKWKLTLKDKVKRNFLNYAQFGKNTCFDVDRRGHNNYEDKTDHVNLKRATLIQIHQVPLTRRSDRERCIVSVELPTSSVSEQWREDHNVTLRSLDHGTPNLRLLAACPQSGHLQSSFAHVRKKSHCKMKKKSSGVWTFTSPPTRSPACGGHHPKRSDRPRPRMPRRVPSERRHPHTGPGGQGGAVWALVRTVPFGGGCH